jgi:hypothetical protein
MLTCLAVSAGRVGASRRRKTSWAQCFADRLGSSGLASAIFLITAGVFFPSFASVTSRSFAAATCAGVTEITRAATVFASRGSPSCVRAYA